MHSHKYEVRPVYETDRLESNVFQLLTSTFFASCRASGTPLSIHPIPAHTAPHHRPYNKQQEQIS